MKRFSDNLDIDAKYFAALSEVEGKLSSKITLGLTRMSETISLTRSMFACFMVVQLIVDILLLAKLM